MWSFFRWIWRVIFEAIWCQLGHILSPKTFPKWGQVGHKIDPSWGVDWRPVFWRLLYGFLYIFVANITWPRARIHRPCRVIINFFVFWLLWCWVDFLLNFDWFLVDFGVENRWKFLPKSIPKAIENKMQVKLEFGRLLDRFLVDFGAKLGAKLEPSWTKNR